MAADLVTAVLSLIPDMGIDLHFWGMGGHANIFGGSSLATMGRFYSGVKSMDAAGHDNQGSRKSRVSGYERRADDWLQQANLAGRELSQIGRQIIGALIAEQSARREYDLAVQQIEQSRETDSFLRDKFTNQALYGWMQGELSKLYNDYYRFALDTARRAERTVKHELMRPEIDTVSYIRPDYQSAGRRGLLAGEGLHLDLKRLEAAFAENNRRELELTRQVSLRQLDPVALLTLRATGRCRFSVPEALFDVEAVHTHRRLRSVALSLPAMVGPNVPLHATLTLLRSSVRVSAQLRDGVYLRGDDDNRFVDFPGGLEQIVTSTGLNDAGLFEPAARDDRPLPFEGAGAISGWQLDLPGPLSSFDRASLSDVVLHLRYTARPAGEIAATQAETEITAALNDASAAGLSQLLMIAQDFPMEWAAFAAGAGDLSLILQRGDFPYFIRDRGIVLDDITLFAAASGRLLRRDLLSRGTAADAVRLDALSDALSTTGDGATLTIPADATVLRRAHDHEAGLLLRYHLA